MLIVKARAARTGPQFYGDHVEQRDASEVFAPASMATWIGAPVTVGHTFVDEKNIADVAVGYVRAAKRGARDEKTGYEHVETELVITDEETAAAIQRGDLVELSAGYSTDLADCVEAGSASALVGTQMPECRQTNIRINHLALGPRDWARCGASCSIAA